MNNLRHLPSVDQLLQTESARSLIGQYGRSLTVEALRSSLEKARLALRQAGKSFSVDSEALLDQAGEALATWFDATLVPVINASGVILHTNLGRAPLSRAALQAVRDASVGYSNLEYDLVKGQRGSRSVHAEGYLQLLLGVEAGLVVNNNAGAVLLALSALAKRRRVIIARSQLVEIGGGFRIPDVMAQSGARLVEVGTTNRVHLSDYEEALREAPGILFHAHHSNFKIVGFTAEPSVKELADLAARYQSILIDDQGSGALLDTSAYGLAHEPTVQESLAAGSDLVCFSGDKLLGGPQAGIVVGRRDLMDKLKRHPLARTLRADKMALAALSATLRHYLKGEAAVAIPIWQMITAGKEHLQARARMWMEQIGEGDLVDGVSAVGGGSLPEETLPTVLLSLRETRPDQFVKHLRECPVPVIARVEDDCVRFDPRTVFPEQDPLLIQSMRETLATTHSTSRQRGLS